MPMAVGLPQIQALELSDQAHLTSQYPAVCPVPIYRHIRQAASAEGRIMSERSVHAVRKIP